MKNKLSSKPNRLLIQFKRIGDRQERIESYRATSTEKAQKIINKRNKKNIRFATFRMNWSKIMTDRNLILSKT